MNIVCLLEFFTGDMLSTRFKAPFHGILLRLFCNFRQVDFFIASRMLTASETVQVDL